MDELSDIDTLGADDQELREQLEGLGFAEVEPAVQLEAANPEATHLVVIRESPKYDKKLLRQMGLQTLRPLADRVPGAQTVLEAIDQGLICYSTDAAGDAWRAEHCAAAFPMREAGGRIYGWRLLVDGSWFIIAATSAVKQDSDEDLTNPFTDQLVQHLDSNPVDHLWAGPFTRLVRRASFGAELKECFDRNRVTVHVKEYPEGLTFGPSAHGIAQMIWGLLCTIAEQEVKMSVLRMFLGKLLKADEDRWERNPDHLPPNAALDDDKKIIETDDPRRLAEARAYVELAAEAFDKLSTPEELSPTDILERLSTDPQVRARITSHSSSSQGEPLTELDHHDVAVRDRFKWIPVMRRGRYQRLHELPMDGCTPDDLLGTPVFEKTVTEHGRKITRQFTVMSWKMPKLDGIDEGTWDKAVRYVKHLSARPRNRHPEHPQDILPLGSIFTGSPEAEGHRRILSSGQGGYELREGPEHGNIREHPVIAKADADLFHTRLVDTILTAAEDDSFPVDLEAVRMQRNAGGRSNKPTDPKQQALESKRQEIATTLAKHQAWLDDDDFPEESKPAIKDRVTALEAHLKKCTEGLEQERVRRERQTPTAGEAEVLTLARLLAVTKKTGRNPLPPEIRRMWSALLVDAKVDAAEHDPWFPVSFRLRMRTTSGDLVTPAMRFSVPNASRGYRVVGTRDDGKPKVKRDRYAKLYLPEMFRRLCVKGLSLEEIAERRDVKAKTLSRQFVKLLRGRDQCYQEPVVPFDGLASAWVDAPPEVRRVLYVAASERGLLRWEEDGAIPSAPEAIGSLPELEDEEVADFGSHLMATYLTPEEETWKVAAWSSGGEVSLRRGLDYVLEASQPTMSGYAELMGWKHTTGSQARVSMRRHIGVLIDWAGESGDEDPALRVKLCPFCGHEGGLHVLPVPELPHRTVCPGCRRASGAPHLKFPDVYLQQWEGPYGNQTVTKQIGGSVTGTRLPRS